MSSSMALQREMNQLLTFDSHCKPNDILLTSRFLTDEFLGSVFKKNNCVCILLSHLFCYVLPLLSNKQMT
jgi:hypothetical protein